LPFWKMRADAGVTLSFDNYDNPNSLDTRFGRFEQREDFEFGVTAGLTKEFNKNIAVRVDYSYTDHNSNVETTDRLKPYEFERNQVGFRLIFTF